jgi:PAS domain S-box-containing protein
MKDTKKTEEQLIAELAESEEKYRIQVEMATDAVFLETVEGRILECNTAGAKMFGYTKEEMVGLTIADLVPEEFAKKLPKVITDKESTYGIFVPRISKKKDGTIFPTEIATTLINIGDKPRLIAYIRDITERKRAEKKRKSLLKKERMQYLKAATLAKIALILTSKLSLSDVLEEILRQVKRLVPYSACNIVLIKKGRLGNVHSQGYDKYGSEKFVNNFNYLVDKLSLEREVIKSARSQLISDTHQDPRWIIFKETSWIRSRLSMPVCLGNKVIGLLNLDSNIPGKFVKDDIKKLQPLANAAAIALENARLFEEVRKEITERKQAEKSLVESEEKYRTIFENTGTATLIIEEDTIISMVNTQFEKLSGYSKDKIENKIKWTDFVIPEDLKVMVDYHTARRKAGENPPTEYEFRFIDRKGNIKNMFLKVGIMPGSKKSIASLIDITENKKSEERLKKTMDATIDTMSKIIEAKDPYTSGHQHRVCQLAIRIAQEMNLPPDKIEGIRIASLIHDIGKIALPAEILSKPTKLTDIEFSLIKGHSQIGYDILKSIDFSYPIAQIVLQHHERLNGSGYPNNLKGNEIIMEAKIIGVADVVEAMSSHRPYRPALGMDKALNEISQNRDILYDLKVVDVCIKFFKEKDFKFE